MTRTIHCTVVEVPAMSDPYLPAPRAFNDLVPWADPYIASLLHKLGCAALNEHATLPARHLQADLEPPLDRNDCDQPWRPDWMPRRWPRG